MTEVKSCKCDHDYQDRKYGNKQRLHNKTTKGFRCTVCSNHVMVTTGKK